MRELRVSSGVGGIGPGPVPTIGEPRGTVLYDAIYLAANEKLKSEVGRKVIVVITDGVDEGSRLTIERGHRGRAEGRRGDLQHRILRPAAPTAAVRHQPGRRRRRARCTRCPTKPAATSTGWTAATRSTRSSRNCRTKCAASIPSATRPLNDSKDGSYRKLDIKLANKDLKAQARKGYYAIKPESPLDRPASRTAK